MKKTWTKGRLFGATQIAAALCLLATPALAQEGTTGGVDDETGLDGAVDDDMGTEESEEAGIEDEGSAADQPVGTLEGEEQGATDPGTDTAPAEDLEPSPFPAGTQDLGEGEAGTETEGIQSEGMEYEGIEEAPQETTEGEEGAMLPGGLEQMGSDADPAAEGITTDEGERQAQSFEGEVRSVDLEAGTVELESEEEGSISLRGASNQLQQLQPGQMVSVTYEDQDDGRWIQEIQAADEQPAAEGQQELEPTEAESVQQPQGKRMAEGGDHQGHDQGEPETSPELSEEPAAAEPAAETEAEAETSPELSEEPAAAEPAAETEAEAETSPELSEEPAAETETSPELSEEPEAEAEAEIETGADQAEAEMEAETSEQLSEEPEAETKAQHHEGAAGQKAAKESQQQTQQQPQQQQAQQQQQQQQQILPQGKQPDGTAPAAFEAADDPAGIGPASEHAPSFSRSPSHQDYEREPFGAEGNRAIP